jgi:hypothetical protein
LPFYLITGSVLDGFIVDDENQPLPKPLHRKNHNAP